MTLRVTISLINILFIREGFVSRAVRLEVHKVASGERELYN